MTQHRFFRIAAGALLIVWMASVVFPQGKKAAHPTPAPASPPALVLMGLSAHPDDEDGTALAVYSVLENVTTYSIFFTRGEGGQNETGSALYDELGAVRTRETLEAAKILKTHVGFLGFPDFGFSKTAKETFAKWGGRDSVLARLVYVIRAAKPDVVITNHDTVTTGPRKQHGNHQAVGITAFEAFAKAADPRFHPEQLRGDITPWQIKKLFFRFRSGADSTRDSLVVIDPKNYFYKSAETVEDLAFSALAKHRSQGMDKINIDSIPPEWRKHRYRLMKSDQEYEYDDTDFFHGIGASRRVSFLPKNVLPDTAGKFVFHIDPEYSSFGYDTSAHAASQRTFILRFGNTTGKPLQAEVLGTYGRTRIFQKAYDIPGDSQAVSLEDTVTLTIDHAKLAAPESLSFLASPSGPGLGPLHLLPQRAKALFRPIPGTFSRAAFVGLVRTYDNTLEETMQSYNVKYALIDSNRIESDDLARFSVILLDLRFGEYRPDVLRAMPRLLEYVRDGGNVVAFYNKTGDWNGKSLAPYRITVTGERVTEEDAPVTELLPGHLLLTVPNLIEPQDWSGWVQERSIYLPSDDTAKTAVNYQRLLAMSDEGEHQPPTSLLSAKYGNGSYTYCALALYRQLRNLNPGAVKLFFNLISQPHR